jgi:predicted DNA-binding transcriptional regulator AlpA
MTDPNPVMTERDLDALLADLPDLLTRREVCTLLQITRRTLDAWMDRRGFPRPLAPTDATHRWAKAGVRRWLARQTAAAGREAVLA